MKAWIERLLLLAACVAAFAHAAPLPEGARQIRFAAIQQPGDAAALQEALARTGRRSPGFTVVNGVKSASEPCTDELYRSRRDVLNRASGPLVLSLAGSDWIGCKADDGTSKEGERLQRVRELFFEGDASFGDRRLKLVRQSLSAKYRGFPENAYWQQGKILFAAIHLPAENNHYLTAAGRNSEFEDRLIANRDWLQRVFSLAKLHRMRGVVLFADGNPMALPVRGNASRRDGFVEMRKLIAQHASRFPGRVLLVHGRAARSASQIAWSGNLGTVGAGPEGLVVTATPATSQVFTLPRERPAGKAKR